MMCFLSLLIDIVLLSWNGCVVFSMSLENMLFSVFWSVRLSIIVMVLEVVIRLFNGRLSM